MTAILKLGALLKEHEQTLIDAVDRLASLLEQPAERRNADEMETAWQAVREARTTLLKFLEASSHSASVRDSANRSKAHYIRTTEKAIKSARKRLRHWTQIEKVVLLQLNAVGQDLAIHPAPPGFKPDVIDHVVTLFLEAMHNIANPMAYTQSDASKAQSLHRDIPLPMGRFSQMIGTALRICLAFGRDRPFRFLDVGSGGGTKVFAATTCFDVCDGLEYEQTTVETGRAFLAQVAPERCRLIHGDALTFNTYNDYDVIYYYRPLMNKEGMIAMEHRIASQTRPGTVLIVPGNLVTPDADSIGVQMIVEEIYVTGLSADEVAALRTQAEYIGRMLPSDARRRFSGLGFWKPLKDVSARNGYFV